MVAHIRSAHLTTICCFAETEDTKEQVNYGNKELEHVRSKIITRKLSHENSELKIASVLTCLIDFLLETNEIFNFYHFNFFGIFTGIFGFGEKL